MSSSRPPARIALIGRVALVLTMCASLGLHWAALQAVAWTQMLVTYSQNADLGEALKQTFDGEHPCDLCLLVKEGQSQQKTVAPLTQKLDAVLPSRTQPLVRLEQPVVFQTFCLKATGFMPVPPTPPPRA